MKRASGILMPISSLPSPYGIGCFSREAYDFVDWLKAAGQTYWQILPMGPTSYGDSPYQSFSTFAGNPYFIDLTALCEKGWLTKAQCEACDWGNSAGSVDYEKIYNARFRLLRTAYENSRIYEDEGFQVFLQNNDYWIYDYALFMALKGRFDQKTWHEWPEDIRKRYDHAMNYYRRECYFDIEFWMFVQYVFEEQWSRLKAYANSQGILIIGDIPIYVADDSADSWAEPSLFQSDMEGMPTAVAGCPPDGFSADGQLWGNPLYDWEAHRRTGFSWWIRRIESCFRRVDVLRIDHFRGFDEYYSIPYGEETARNGHWEKGSGIALFNAITAALGERAIIAEDLGFMTESVRTLVKESGYPSMKVLEFAFDERDTGSAGDYLPHNYPENAVVYTGTHDNETLAGWWSSISGVEKQMVRNYFRQQAAKDSEIPDIMICGVMMSVAKLCIIPMQDYLGLDNSARMNQPSTIGKNWRWRMEKKQMTDALAERICDITKLYGRFGAHL